VQDLSLKALRSFSGVGVVDLWAPTTALLLIDMQVDCIHAIGYTIRRLRERGLDDAVAQYERQCGVAIPNLARLLARVRANGQMVIHTRAVKMVGRQPGGQERAQRVGTPNAEQIIEELAPRPDEVLLSKSCSGVFAGTNLDFLLRRLGITSLIVGGVVTNGCVEHAVIHAHDLGYACVLVSDGCAALTDEIHENALERLEHRRAHVLPTGAILSMSQVAPTKVLSGAAR
jgi:nicotinamidase-related amidase